jgi:hypothetical protein
MPARTQLKDPHCEIRRTVGRAENHPNRRILNALHLNGNRLNILYLLV